jgi:hypothetical protein
MVGCSCANIFEGVAAWKSQDGRKRLVISALPGANGWMTMHYVD